MFFIIISNINNYIFINIIIKKGIQLYLNNNINILVIVNLNINNLVFDELLIKKEKTKFT